MERIRAMLPECKLYAMVAFISATVWIAGFSANVNQQARFSEWLAPIERHRPVFADAAHEDEELLLP